MTALEAFFDAAATYARAQHPIFVNNTEKRSLHAASIRCYDEVRRLAPSPIEHIDVPWQGTLVSGNLHLAPVDGPAPLIFFVPGCDMTKEVIPHPLYNWAAHRGMHIFVFDGPGQGESNLRGIKLTEDNYEDAASAALTHLLARPDVDPERIGLFGISFGSYWAARIAATDQRIKATVLGWASICDKYYLFEEESPRYKQLFAYLTQAENEEELDQFVEHMALESMMPRITAPTLLTIGEYDPRSPLEEIYDMFDLMKAPAELWVFGDQHHMVTARGGDQPDWARDSHTMGVDWLGDRFREPNFERAGEVRYVEPGLPGPYAAKVALKRRWFE